MKKEFIYDSIFNMRARQFGQAFKTLFLKWFPIALSGGQLDHTLKLFATN